MFLLILLMLISTPLFASQVTVPYVFSTNDTVTNVKLNGNNNAITNTINGGLDNTNANTTSGYRFYQTVAALPVAGSQGAVYFLTSDNTLNFDNGSSFIKSVAVSAPVQGDIIYYDGASWQNLAPGTANYVLVTGGSGANPSWASNPSVIINATNIKGNVGSKTSKSISVTYQALTDGFVNAFGNKNSIGNELTCKTDSSSTPTTTICISDGANNAAYSTCAFHVKKLDYYVCTDNQTLDNFTMYFTQLGS